MATRFHSPAARTTAFRAIPSLCICTHETLGDFPKGNISYSVHTDTNHNVKNSRYQLVVGFNSESTIGVYMIDAGLLKKAGISQELYRVTLLLSTC
jgi:hypothetical protein